MPRLVDHLEVELRSKGSYEGKPTRNDFTIDLNDDGYVHASFPFCASLHNRGIAIRLSERSFLSKNSFYVEPDKEADASPSPVFSALAGLPSCSGLVAEALKLCSKSAMMSSMCSVPTEMRMRS
jgi:hypothetical protein